MTPGRRRLLLVITGEELTRLTFSEQTRKIQFETISSHQFIVLFWFVFKSLSRKGTHRHQEKEKENNDAKVKLSNIFMRD